MSVPFPPAGTLHQEQPGELQQQNRQESLQSVDSAYLE